VCQVGNFLLKIKVLFLFFRKFGWGEWELFNYSFLFSVPNDKKTKGIRRIPKVQVKLK
jgi:hypothetical protein